jgi:hypothetical protein
MSKKLKRHIFVLAIAFFGFIAGWYCLFNIIQPPSSPLPETQSNQENKQVSLTLDYGENKKSYVHQFSENETAFSILKDTAETNNIPLETEQYDFGVFVKSINGYENSTSKAWIYFVNGQSGQVAADKHTLKPGDIVEWKYTTPSVNGQ